MLKLQNRFKRTQHSRWLLQGTDSLNTCANTVTWRCHSNPRQASNCLTVSSKQQQTAPPWTVPALPVHRPSGAPTLRHHSYDKVKFKNKFLLRNALVFILRFKMVFWAVWNRKGARSHTPHKAPGYPASTHCSNSQHRWTNGKERDQLGYFPPVKSQHHDNKGLQI